MRLPSNILIKTLLRAVLADESLVEQATIDDKEYATFSRTYKKGTDVVTLALPIQDNIVQASELPRSQQDIVDGRGGKSPLDTGTMEKPSETVPKSEWVPPANASSGMKYPSMQDTFMRKRFEQARMKRESLVQAEATVQAETPVQAETNVESKPTDEEERLARLRQASRQTESYLKNYTYEPTLPVEPSTVEEETTEYGVKTATRQPFALEYQEWKFLLHCCASLTDCSHVCTHGFVSSKTMSPLPEHRQRQIMDRVCTLLKTVRIVEKGGVVPLCECIIEKGGVILAWGNRCIIPGKNIGWFAIADSIVNMRERDRELQQDIVRVSLRGLRTTPVSVLFCQEYGVDVFDAIRLNEVIGKAWYRRLGRIVSGIGRYISYDMRLPKYEGKRMWYDGNITYVSRTETRSGGIEDENVSDDMG